MSTASTPPPSADASYLRRLLERQPACLIRVGLDDGLLACNDAALSLFGVDTLGVILNTNLTDRIVAAEQGKWREFAARVWANGAASLECHLAAPDGDPRPVLFQGIALKDHPDGLDSLLFSLRDQSQTHRLQHSIQSAKTSRDDEEEQRRSVRDQLEEALTDVGRLKALVDEHQTERTRLTEALDARTAERERGEAAQREQSLELQRRAEKSQLALLVGEREMRDRIAALEAELAASVAERRRLESRPEQHAPQEPASGQRRQEELADVEVRLRAATGEGTRLRALVAQHEAQHEAQREQIAADHRAAVETLEQSLAQAGEKAALGIAQARQTLADLRSQLSRATAEQSRLSARVEEHERERDRLNAEHLQAIEDLKTSKADALAELRLRLSQAVAEQDRLSERVEEHDRERDRLGAEGHRGIAHRETSKSEALAELRAQLSQAVAEHSRLSARVEEHERERDRLDAEHLQAIADLKTSKADALAELRLRLSQALAEQDRLSARVEEHDRERDRLSAAHHHAITDLQISKADALAELRAQLSQALDEQSRLSAWVEEHERERDRLSVEHQRAIADLRAGKSEALAELRAQLSQALAEQSRLSTRVDGHERERDRVSAEHLRAIADLQTSKADALAECERLLNEIKQALLGGNDLGVDIARRLTDDIDQAAQEKGNGELIASVQADLTRAVSEMQTLLAQGEHREARLQAEVSGDRERAERALDEAIRGKQSALKTLADERLELQRWQEAAIELEPLAAAGRLAADVARELQGILERIDRQAQALVMRRSPEAISRSDIEILRADALRAASLARQFVLSKIRPVEVRVPLDMDCAPVADGAPADPPDDSPEDS